MANPMMAQLMAALSAGQRQTAPPPPDYSRMSDLELSRLSINDPNAAASLRERTAVRQTQRGGPAPSSSAPLPSTTPGLAPAPTLTNQGGAMNMLDRFGPFAEAGQEPIQRTATGPDDGGMQDIISGLGAMRGKFGPGTDIPGGGGETLGGKPSYPSAGLALREAGGTAWDAFKDVFSEAFIGKRAPTPSHDVADTGYTYGQDSSAGSKMPGTTPFNPEGPRASVDIPASMAAPRGGGGTPAQASITPPAFQHEGAVAPPGGAPGGGGILSTEAGPNAGGPETQEQRLIREFMSGGSTPAQDSGFKIGREGPKKSFLESLGINDKDLLQFGLAMAAAGEPQRGRLTAPTVMGAAGIAGLRTTKLSRKREEKKYRREVAKATTAAEQSRHRDKIAVDLGKISSTEGLRRETLRIKDQQNQLMNQLKLMQIRAQKANTRVSMGTLATRVETDRNKAINKIQEMSAGTKEMKTAVDAVNDSYDQILRSFDLPVADRGDKKSTLERARDAIAKGANPEAVKKRLQDMGIDPNSL